MKNCIFCFIAAIFFTSFFGCSTHNSPAMVVFPPHQGRVFITEQTLPSSVEFELISTIEVEKKWYGSTANALMPMAERARKLGANAVIQVRTWFAPSGFSWAAPHAAGQAVMVQDINLLESNGIKGTWN